MRDPESGSAPWNPGVDIPPRAGLPFAPTSRPQPRAPACLYAISADVIATFRTLAHGSGFRQGLMYARFPNREDTSRKRWMHKYGGELRMRLGAMLCRWINSMDQAPVTSHMCDTWEESVVCGVGLLQLIETGYAWIPLRASHSCHAISRSVWHAHVWALVRRGSLAAGRNDIKWSAVACSHLLCTLAYSCLPRYDSPRIYGTM